jgi:hypothetical protein
LKFCVCGIPGGALFELSLSLILIVNSCNNMQAAPGPLSSTFTGRLFELAAQVQAKKHSGVVSKLKISARTLLSLDFPYRSYLTLSLSPLYLPSKLSLQSEGPVSDLLRGPDGLGGRMNGIAPLPSGPPLV